MITELVNCFDNQQQYYLDKIVYSRLLNNSQEEQHELSWNDSISASVNGEEVIVTITRCVKFEPEDIFTITVSYGSILKINSESISKYNWKELNLAEEFKENGQFVLGHLLARISLLIGQITSSFGQQPLILPPEIKK